jgi:plasmid stabilization system protein ParE
VGAIQTILQIVKAPAPEVGRKIEGLSRDIWGFQGHSRAVRKLSDANLRYQVDRIYQGMIDGIERQLDHLLISFSEKSHGALYDAAAEQGVDHLLMPTVTGNQILSYPPGRIVLSDQARLYWLPKATSPAPVIAKPDAPKSDSRHKKKEQRRIEKILKARAGLGAGTESESRDSIPFRLVYSQLAKADLDALLSDHSQERHYNAVKRALGKMERDPREPVLHSHNPTSDRAHRHLWISHAENHTPGAYRIFWRYGRGQTIQILRITRHPNSSPREYIRAAEKADRIKISE